MKSVIANLFRVRNRLEEAWASTQVDQPDTMLLDLQADDQMQKFKRLLQRQHAQARPFPVR